MFHFSQICSSTTAGSLLFAILLSITMLLLHCCCRGQCQKKKKSNVVRKAQHSRFVARKPKTRPSHPSGAKKGRKTKSSSENEFEQLDNVPLAKPIDSLTCGCHMRRAPGTSTNNAPAVKTAVNMSAEPLPKTFTLGKKEQRIKDQNIKKDIASDPYPTISMMFSNSNKSE